MKLNFAVDSIVGTPASTPDGFVEPSKFPEMIAGALTSILALSAVIATLFIIIGGVQMAISGGDSGKLKTAQASVQWVVVGFVVSIGGFAIVRLIASILGIDSIDLVPL